MTDKLGLAAGVIGPSGIGRAGLESQTRDGLEDWEGILVFKGLLGIC
jgi:hypothetical protein